MANPDFLIKKDDTLPNIRLELLNPDGTPFVITVGDVFALFFQDVSDGLPAKPSIVGAGTFTTVGTGSTGEVDYAWAAADTANVGSFRAEVQVTPLSGGIITFPGGSYILFDVVQDLGD